MIKRRIDRWLEEHYPTNRWLEKVVLFYYRHTGGETG